MSFCYRVPTSSEFSSKCLIIKVGLNPVGITKRGILIPLLFCFSIFITKQKIVLIDKNTLKHSS